MRTNNKQTVYLSDLLTVPMPTQASSHAEYLRKIRIRRLMWAILPGCMEAIGLILLVLLTIFGISVCAISMGGV